MTILYENWSVSIAALLSFAWCLLHFFGGGATIAKPLRQASSLDHTVMATMWMCWHMVTATLFLMGVFFVMGLVWGTAYVVAGTLLAAAIAVAGIGAKYALGTSFAVLFQGWLFVPIAVLGAYSALGS